MPLNERDYAREPLPAEQIRVGNSQNLVDDLEEIEAVMTADGFKFERVKSVTLNWWDFLFWLVLLLAAKGCG